MVGTLNESITLLVLLISYKDVHTILYKISVFHSGSLLMQIPLFGDGTM
jgi:hypothetical protein